MTTVTQRIDPRTQRAIDAYMAALPGTKTEIIKSSGLNHSTVAKFTKRLHGSGVRICAWLPHPVRGPEIPVFDVGADPDAIDKRKRLTRRQIHRRYEKSIKGTEVLDRRRAKQASIYFEKKAKKKPNTWFSVLGAP